MFNDKNTLIDTLQKLENDLLKDYKDSVKTLFSIKSNMSIANSNTKHATIINSMILKFAPDNGHVYFLCKSLHNDCFGSDEIIQSLNDALSRNVKVHVACTDSISPKNKFTEVLDSKNMLCKNVPEVKINEKTINFSTNGIGFRFEPDAEQYKAFVCSNNEAVSKLLVGLFEHITK